MHDTTLFNRLLALSGISVADVSIGTDTVTVDVRVRTRPVALPALCVHDPCPLWQQAGGLQVAAQ